MNGSGRNGYARRQVHLVAARRTPFLKARGVRGPFSAADLALAAGRELLLTTGVAADQLDEVVLGCVGPSVDEMNIARIVSLRLGCGHAVPAWTVQRNCASGMQAIDVAAKDISLGRADLVLAGGTEAMSHAPLQWSPELADWLGRFVATRRLPERGRLLSRLRPAWFRPVVGLLRALRDPVVNMGMGQTAEELAYRFDIPREAMDAFASRSHERLLAARKAGRLDEVTTLFTPSGEVLAEDDGARADSTPQRLARLQPVFDPPAGRVTAGNSSQVTDGAALVLLASGEALRRLGLASRAQIIDCAWAGVDPAQMGLGPVHAIAPLLARNERGFEEVDYWEINEAFAAQVIACQRALADAEYCQAQLGLDGALGAIDDARLNVDGGAVACGHPVGASGARIVAHLAETLHQRDARIGVASICIGGGQGGAMLLERRDD